MHALFIALPAVFITEYSAITADDPFGIVYIRLFVCMQRRCLGGHHLHQGHMLNWRRRSGVTNLLR